MIKINFQKTIKPVNIAPDFRYMQFYSKLRNNENILLKVKIEPLENPLLPDVFNLAFGPQTGDENVDHDVKLDHAESDRVFSTIMLFGLWFLEKYPSTTIGINGADDARAYLYHRMFLTNKQYLEGYFTAYGVDWFVRLLRQGDLERDLHGLPFFKPKPEFIDCQRPIRDLYQYYLFRLS